MIELKVSRIDISTLQEKVYQELRTALFRSRFAPGETITIRSLAKALGTSEMPVREAVQRLVAEKALQQTPSRSIQVTPLTLERHDEMTRIRMTIEGLAVKRATPYADGSLIRLLKRLNLEMVDAAMAKEWLSALERNQEFHFAIYGAARSPQLLEIIESLWLRTGPYLASAYNGPKQPEVMLLRGAEAHDRLIVGLERRDSKAAMKAMMLDIKAAANWYRRYCNFSGTP
jgi:DNA-binding GntR family transcriptional regulator